MIAIWLVMLAALVGLGSLAAVVFAIVYAIANKKPGVALAAVLVPLGAIVSVGLLAALLAGRASYHVQGPVHTDVHWAVNSPPSPPSPPVIEMPQMPAMPQVPAMPNWNHEGATPSNVKAWVMFAPLIAIVIVFMAFRKHGCTNGGRGWGKAIAAGMLLFLAAGFFFVRMSQKVQVAQGQQQAEIDHAEQIRLDVENADRKAIEVQHQVEDAQRKLEEAIQENAAKEHSIEFKSMQELWEKLNQPRIKLESDDHGASMQADVGGKIVKIEAPAEGDAQVIVPISGETPESLNRSLARLERMVERVSNMADQLSDAGTLVGKAMVALNETIDSKRSSPPISEVAVVQAAAPQLPDAAKVAEELVPLRHPAAAAPVSDLKVPADSELPNEEAKESKKIDEPRPDWLREPPRRVAGKWREIQVSDEFVTDEECYGDADARLRAATEAHLKHLVAGSTNRADSHVPSLDELGVGIDFIRAEIVTDEYFETVQRSFGPMRKVYTKVEFTPTVDAQLRQKWDEYRRQERFAMVGVGAGSVLGLLGMAFGLLKVDTWTKGYYTKRLFLGVPAAIIGLIGLLGLAAG